MSDGQAEQIIDHQAQLQRRLDMVDRQVLILAVCVLALTGILIAQRRMTSVG